MGVSNADIRINIMHDQRFMFKYITFKVISYKTNENKLKIIF